MFLPLYNLENETDYETGTEETQKSIVDRRGISKSGNYPDLKLQIKEIKEWDEDLADTTKGVKAFDLNIFRFLLEKIEKAEKKYKADPEVVDTILLLEVGVTKRWLDEWKVEKGDKMQKYSFKNIFCIAKASNLNDTYIFKLQ
ncbi:MAG: hypothetical protein WC817_05275 [Patescibacteria group bacterium]